MSLFILCWVLSRVPWFFNAGVPKHREWQSRCWQHWIISGKLLPTELPQRVPLTLKMSVFTSRVSWDLPSFIHKKIKWPGMWFTKWLKKITNKWRDTWNIPDCWWFVWRMPCSTMVVIFSKVLQGTVAPQNKKHTHTKFILDQTWYLFNFQIVLAHWSEISDFRTMPYDKKAVGGNLWRDTQISQGISLFRHKCPPKNAYGAWDTSALGKRQTDLRTFQFQGLLLLEHKEELITITRPDTNIVPEK